MPRVGAIWTSWMPAPSSMPRAAWARVRPRIVRTREYLLKADFVRKLAHRESRRAGATKSRYVGSKNRCIAWTPSFGFQNREPGPTIPGGLEWMQGHSASGRSRLGERAHHVLGNL